jgi:hypothetical protein
VLTGAAVLLAAAFVADAGGVAALPGRTHPAGWLGDAGTATGVTIGLAGLVVLAALIALVTRRRRRRRDEPPRVVVLPPTSRLTQALVLAVVIGALAAPFVLIVTTPRHPAATRPPVTVTEPRSGPPPTPARSRPAASTGGRHLGRDALLLGALAVAIAAAAGVAARRRPGDDAAPDDGTDVENLGAEVAAAATAASSALDVADGDPRSAVIAAYTAMTRTLSAADPKLRATDTPGRLLDRAAAAGVVDVTAAAALIGLFEHARFSTHPVTAAHVTAARDALARVTSSARAFAGAR